MLCFEGVESAFYLYVNGQRVGYSESSFNRAEFDVTRYLQEGSNVIGVEVYRWCTGSLAGVPGYVACLGGIFRDVYLYTTEREYIRDFVLKAQPDGEMKDGFVEVLVKTNGMPTRGCRWI